MTTGRSACTSTAATLDRSDGGHDLPEAVTGMLDRSTFATVADELIARDPALAAIVAEHGLPPFWSRPTGFRSLVLLILEQQVSLASGAAVYRRLRDRVRTVTPAVVLACSPDELRADGISRQKDRYLRALATAVEDGTLDLDALESMDDDAVRQALVALPGIGPWTADVYLLACLGRPDLWPVGDRALQVAAAEALGLAAVPDPRSRGARHAVATTAVDGRTHPVARLPGPPAGGSRPRGPCSTTSPDVGGARRPWSSVPSCPVLGQRTRTPPEPPQGRHLTNVPRAVTMAIDR